MTTSTTNGTRMKRIETSIDVHVPVATAYNQWTQFEEYSRFMRSVLEVEQLDDRRLHWRARIGGKLKEWDAEIVEQIPDKRIAWRSTSGSRHSGLVTFHALSHDKCRVMLQLEYAAEGVIERIGGFLGVPRTEVEDDLRSFANFVEARETETGAWHGRIPPREGDGGSPERER